MKLLTISLRNFKGIKSFSLNTKAGNVAVNGDNATGKTTIFDGFNWLIFGKDSQNKADFSIKPLDDYGNELHHLATEVEASFDIDGRIVTIKKVFYEKWTKKRGSANQEFTGHTTDQYIDDVPKPKKEYDEFIAGIVDESIFKLLTNPAYFNEQLHWQDRRKILLEICGGTSDEEVISSDTKLAKLPKILNGRTLDDHRKVIQSRQAAINKELKEIPARIDEVQRGLTDVSGIFSREVIETEIASLKKQQGATQQEIVRIENGGEVAEQQKKLREVEGRLIDIQNRYRADTQDKAFEKKNKLHELQYKSVDIGGQVADKESLIECNNKVIKSKENNCEDLRSLWNEAYKAQFEYSAETVCPTCGQALPEDQVATAREKALNDFNLKKSQRLESINAEGKKAKQVSEELKAQNVALQTGIDALVASRLIIEQSITTLQSEIDSMASEAVPDIKCYPEYKQAVAAKETIQSNIVDLNNKKQEVIRKLQSEVNILAQDIEARERNIAQLDAHERNLSRITELEEQEKTLGAEYEKLQGELYLTEEFIRTKVNLLESKINSKFKMARFKLFEQQVNGGINEICETIVKGVPYGGGLNNAARINVGLDIINTLSEHYDFTAPIFIDNAEAVTQLIETDAQVISLVVSAADKSLRVEYQDQETLFKEAV